MARITVEDCLEQVPNRFELVLLGARRAKQLLKGARPLVESDNKEIVTALRDIADTKVLLHYADGSVGLTDDAEREGPIRHPRARAGPIGRRDPHAPPQS